MKEFAGKEISQNDNINPVLLHTKQYSCYHGPVINKYKRKR